MLFVVGARWTHIFATVLFGGIFLWFVAILKSNMRIDRMSAFFDLLFDRTYVFNPDAYQSMYSLYSIGQGGINGVGIGGGMVKTRLPEAYNDFILSTIAEEMGIFWRAIGNFAIYDDYS